MAHVRRVAKASPGFARPVAWLHEVLEDSSVSEEELLAGGLTEEELRALRLLTRPSESRSSADYFTHIGLIASSAGSAGEIARSVKRLDLADRLQHPNLRADGWHPPYLAALESLNSSGAGSDSQSSSRKPLPSPLGIRSPASRGAGSQRA